MHSTKNTSCTMYLHSRRRYVFLTQSQSYTVPCDSVKCARAFQTVYHECCNRTMLISCSNIQLVSFPDPFTDSVYITSSIAQYTLKVIHIRAVPFPGPFLALLHNGEEFGNGITLGLVWVWDKMDSCIYMSLVCSTFWCASNEEKEGLVRSD